MRSWRRKTYEATLYQWLIQDALALEDLLSYKGKKLGVPSALHYEGIALTVIFFIPPAELRVADGSHFKGRDVSNYMKLIEDAVFEYLGRTDSGTYPVEKAKIGDSADLEPLAFKRLSPDNNWHIHIHLSNQVSALSPYVYCDGVIGI